MTKAREIAELGQKLTVDGSGNLDIAGSGTFDELTVDGSVSITDTTGIGLGAANPSQFGSGVPTIAFQGTADNGRAGALNFREYAASGDGAITSQIYATDGSDGYGFVLNAQQGSLKLNAGGLTSTKLEVKTSGVVINEQSGDNDFRVESDSNNYALFLDAGTGRFVIGDSAASYDLSVRKTNAGGDVGLSVENRDETQTTGSRALLALTADVDNDGTLEQFLHIRGGNNTSGFAEYVTRLGASMRFQGDAGTSAVFNDSGVDMDFRVESDGNENMLFVDAGDNAIGIGTNAPLNRFNQTVAYQWFDTTSTFVTIDGGNKEANINLQAVGDEDDHQIGGIWWTNKNGQSDAHRQIAGISARMVNGNSIAGGDLEIWTKIANAGATTPITTFSGSGLVTNQYGAVINESGSGDDKGDFRVESDTRTHAIFVDASGDKVGLMDSSPDGNYPVTIGGRGDKQLLLRSTGDSGYTQGAMVIASGTTDNPGNRGQGVYSFNEGNDHTYYMGSSYGHGTSQAWIVGHGTGANFLAAAADKANAVFNIYPTSTGSGTVFNENSFDRDFRVESDTNAYAFFVDAGNSVIGIGTSTPATYASGGGIAIKGSTASDLSLVASSIASGVNSHQMRYWNEAGASYEIARTRVNVGAGQVNRGEYQFAVNNGAGLRPWLDVDYGGNVVFNQQGYDSDFRVESDNQSHMLLVDAANDRVVIGGTTQAAKLTVQGGTTTENTMFVYGEATGKGGRIVSIRDTRATPGTEGSSGLHLTSSPGTDYVLAKYYDGSLSHFMLTDQLGNEYITVESANNIVINQNGFSGRDFRVESGTSTHAIFVDAGENAVGLMRSDPGAGVVADNAKIGWGGGGQILQSVNSSAANGEYAELTINSGGGGFTGQLFITNTVSNNAAVRTHKMYFLAGRGTDCSTTQLGTDTGASGGADFTITFPSNGKVRVTNNNGSTCQVSILFIGTKTL